MVAASDCAVVMLLDAGVTVTVGVVGFWLVHPTAWLPPPHAPIERAIAKRRRTMQKSPLGNFLCRCIPLIRNLCSGGLHPGVLCSNGGRNNYSMRWSRLAAFDLIEGEVL